VIYTDVLDAIAISRCSAWESEKARKIPDKMKE